MTHSVLLLPAKNAPRRMANRLRSALPEEERAALERSLATLAPVFDLRAPHPADATAGQQPDVGPALAAGHAVIEELAAAGCERADALVQAATDSAAQLVLAPPAGAAAGGGEAQAAAASGEQQQQVAGGSGEGAAPAADAAVAPAALKTLQGLHADAVRSVAELCSLCLERLLALGRSLSSHYRYGRPADDGERSALVAVHACMRHLPATRCCSPLHHITPMLLPTTGIAWPADAEAAGLALRCQALRMLEDLSGMAAAFGAALSEMGAALDGAAGSAGASKAYAGAAKPLAHALQQDSEAAAARVHDATRALLQVVWLKTVPRERLEDLL